MARAPELEGHVQGRVRTFVRQPPTRARHGRLSAVGASRILEQGRPSWEAGGSRADRVSPRFQRRAGNGRSSGSGRAAPRGGRCARRRGLSRGAGSGRARRTGGIHGSPGDPGPAGQQGDPSCGAQGDPGYSWAAGEPGPAGAAGPQGDPGPGRTHGAAGRRGRPVRQARSVLARGTEGDVGPAGPVRAIPGRRATGRPGAPGPAGDPGPQGTEGATGATGATARPDQRVRTARFSRAGRPPGRHRSDGASGPAGRPPGPKASGRGDRRRCRPQVRQERRERRDHKVRRADRRDRRDRCDGPTGPCRASGCDPRHGHAGHVRCRCRRRDAGRRRRCELRIGEGRLGGGGRITVSSGREASVSAAARPIRARPIRGLQWPSSPSRYRFCTTATVTPYVLCSLCSSLPGSAATAVEPRHARHHRDLERPGLFAGECGHRNRRVKRLLRPRSRGSGVRRCPEQAQRANSESDRCDACGDRAAIAVSPPCRGRTAAGRLRCRYGLRRGAAQPRQCARRRFPRAREALRASPTSASRARRA